MGDRELLELAAKAAGIEGKYVECYGSGDYYYRGNPDGILYYMPDGLGVVWNPLDDDGDALRLMVKLGIATYPPEENGKSATSNSPGHNAPWITVPAGDDPTAATRRAIVRAAAEIGKSMA